MQVLAAEYGLLTASLAAAWSASLFRTSIYLAVLSAAGVALGFAAQAGTAGAEFRALAVVVLPLVLFLGLTTFERLVEVQREATIYLTGQNRIRYFFQQVAPAGTPYYVLPAHDDLTALYRSVGTGMHRQPPRYRLLRYVSQTQGIVGIVTGVVAGATAGLLTVDLSPVVAWFAATIAFGATVVGLVVYWQRSLAEVQGAIRPINPTPPDEIEAAF
jgi:hypothetical protein